jgi:hypothetical protein
MARLPLGETTAPGYASLVIRPMLAVVATLALTVGGLSSAEATAERHMCPRSIDEFVPPASFDADRIEGKTLGDARALARKWDCSVRVVARNHESFVVTDDFNTGRINVAVVDHRIRRVVGIF